jgi:hypothetical protein
MPEVPAKTETGIKWWLRYVIVPLIGSGGLLGLYLTARQLLPPGPAQGTPAITASLPAGTLEPTVTSTFSPTPTAWPPGDQISSDPRSRCAVAAAGLADPDRENAVVVQFKISSRGGYCTWITPLNGFNPGALKQISFWVKGGKGGETYEVGLRNRGMPDGTIPQISQTASNRWNQVVISLDRFRGLEAASLEELSLTMRTGSGDLYVDRIEFLP